MEMQMKSKNFCLHMMTAL